MDRFCAVGNVVQTGSVMLRRSIVMSKATTTMTREQGFPQLLAVQRIIRIPFIESSWLAAANVYSKIKTSNPLFNWGLGQAEASMFLVLDSTKPAVNLLNKPLSVIDSILCKSLDLVEEKVPVVTLPPELIYVSTKDYVSHSLVEPVLKRADSMKQFGLHQANTVLTSKYTTYAADQLDTALTIADKYVDRYLPEDLVDGQPSKSKDNDERDRAHYSKAAQTMHHVDVFSRKLQRRLTRRTIAEARALKKQSVDAVTFMINMVELLARDPKAAMEKAAILWAHLSEDEPENQARPQNLEQLTVMISREMARRIVHFVNFARKQVATLPINIAHSVDHSTATFVHLAEVLVKKTHLVGVKDLALTTTRQQALKLQTLIINFNLLAIQILELVAATIAGKHRSHHANGSASSINNETNEAGRLNHHTHNNYLHNSFE